MGSVLTIDTQATLEPLIHTTLEADGFTIVEAKHGSDARQVLRDRDVDVVIVEAERDSAALFSMIRSVREQTPAPIVVVSEQAETVDKVFALEFGADEFFVKPLDMLEFRARLHVLMRRSNGRTDGARSEGSGRIAFGSWIMDPLRRELIRRDDGGQRDLTGAEFELLSVFVGSPNRVLSRDELTAKLRQRPWTPFDRGIDMLVRRLRLKVEDDPSRPRLIRTIRSLGYMFAERVEPCD